MKCTRGHYPLILLLVVSFIFINLQFGKAQKLSNDRITIAIEGGLENYGCQFQYSRSIFPQLALLANVEVNKTKIELPALRKGIFGSIIYSYGLGAEYKFFNRPNTPFLQGTLSYDALNWGARARLRTATWCLAWGCFSTFANRGTLKELSYNFKIGYRWASKDNGVLSALILELGKKTFFPTNLELHRQDDNQIEKVFQDRSNFPLRFNLGFQFGYQF